MVCTGTTRSVVRTVRIVRTVRTTIRTAYRTYCTYCTYCTGIYYVLRSTYTPPVQSYTTYIRTGIYQVRKEEFIFRSVFGSSVAAGVGAGCGTYHNKTRFTIYEDTERVYSTVECRVHSYVRVRTLRIVLYNVIERTRYIRGKLSKGDTILQPSKCRILWISINFKLGGKKTT